VSEEPVELRAVGRTQLEPVVRQALRCSTARVHDWQWRTLPYQSFLADRTLARFTGSALIDGYHAVPWSSILKLFRRPALSQPGERASGAREILAYRSSLLADLPGLLRAPRILGIDEEAGGAAWLWLEEVSDLYAHRWPLEQYGLAARHLGVFNGAYLTSRPLPTDAWLNAWLDRHWAEHHAELDRTPQAWADLQRLTQLPQVQRVLGATIASRTAQLLEDQARFVRTLSLLPQTLCHHDAALANLFARHRPDGQLETVAVDWENMGLGSVGAEIATLVFGTMRRCEFDAERAMELDQVVFTGYVAGLREAGWQGHVERVRLGYTAAVALRWTLLARTLRLLVEGAPRLRTSHGRSVPPDEVAKQWVRLSAFLLERADEARRLTADRPSAH
jgi:hypothetical protein